jgi:flagellar biosynthesis protein
MNQRLQAIALEYGPNTVPIVVAKGDDAVAAMIVEEARRQGVYVSEDPQLLALLSRLNVDDEIPMELYTTVAVILSWVYWLKGMRPGDEKAATVKAEKAPEKAAEAVPETPTEKPPEESANQAS